MSLTEILGQYDHNREQISKASCNKSIAQKAVVASRANVVEYVEKNGLDPDLLVGKAKEWKDYLCGRESRLKELASDRGSKEFRIKNIGKRRRGKYDLAEDPQITPERIEELEKLAEELDLTEDPNFDIVINGARYLAGESYVGKMYFLAYPNSKKLPIWMNGTNAIIGTVMGTMVGALTSSPRAGLIGGVLFYSFTLGSTSRYSYAIRPLSLFGEELERRAKKFREIYLEAKKGGEEN